jgi:hypothetical protein
MPIEPNTALTPDKKGLLLEEIKSEIDSLSKSLKEKRYNDAAYLILQNAKDSLQKTLDTLLAKKGVITPAQSNDALDKINSAKKTRLEQDYSLGMKRTTLIAVGLLVLGVGYYIYKKQKK